MLFIPINLRKKEEYPEVFSQIMGEDYILLEEYQGHNKKLKVHHRVCGKEYLVSPNAVKAGNKCPICALRKRTKSPEQYKKEFNDKVRGKYKLLSEYTVGTDEVKVLHVSCGNEFYVIAKKIFEGVGCPKCFGTRRYTQKEYESKVNIKLGEGYKVTSQYINIKSPIEMEHSCGYRYQTLASVPISGSGCPKCGGTKHWTEQEFKDFITPLGYTLLSSFKGMVVQVEVKHIACDNKYLVYPSNFVHGGNRCKQCFRHSKRSRGETKISEYLVSKKLYFVEEATFDECVNVTLLPFDFFIPSLNLIIEYDGQQHFRPVEFFGGEKTYQDTVLRDGIKNDYCKLKGINLVRIPYTDEDNIETILDKELTKFTYV